MTATLETPTPVPVLAFLSPWQIAWRKGIAPLLPTQGLTSLRIALQEDLACVVQGEVAVGYGHQMDGNSHRYGDQRAVVGACAIGFCGWADGLETVGEAQEYYDRITDTAQFGGVRPGHFTGWFDCVDRGMMRRELLPEIALELARRERGAP